MTRAAAVCLTVVVLLAQPVLAQDGRETLVVVMDGASLPDLLGTLEFRSLASHGGAALMNGRVGARRSIRDALASDPPAEDVGSGPWPIAYRDLGHRSAHDAAREVSRLLEASIDRDDPTLVLVISASPSAASAVDGDELGTVIAAWGDPDELLSADGEPRALTSDSTRRAGVVADVDAAATVAAWLDLPYDPGAPIRPTDEPAPLELYERYLQQRGLAVPVAATSWTLLGAAALASIAIVRLRDRLATRTLLVAMALAAAFPWLALALLLVGHLPELTVWIVVPFVAVVAGGGAALTTWAASRWGALRAIAGTGVAILLILLVEALTGWAAAVTPLAGGGQLDGGRFFGMPNAEIGLVLGAAVYAAHRLGPTWGAALLVLCALLAGSPWTGANLGAAITLSAAAGLWLGLRSWRRPWLVALAAAATTIVGTGVVVAMHRFLSARPTHVTAFAADPLSLRTLVERAGDRLRIGLELIADSPFALVPVLGTLVLLVLVARPPASLAATFAASDAWRDALLVLLLGAIVAYVANDTGAAALGFGFVFALAAAVHVSAAAARGMMGR